MNPKNEQITDVEPINAVVELKEGVAPVSSTEVSEEIKELAEIDPVAALISNLPHKSRAIAENYIAKQKEPDVRHEQSDRERALGLRGRVIYRDYKLHGKFLKGRFWPANGRKEVARRLRKAGKSAE